MLTLRTTILFLCVIISSTAFAGDFIFKILATSGGCTFDHGARINAKARAGTQLVDGDSLIVPDSAYCGLLYNNGRTLELRDAGSYSVADLVAKVPQGSSSISKRVMKYVVNQMSQTSTPEDATDQHQLNMGTTGSVERLSGDQINLKDKAVDAIKNNSGNTSLGSILGKKNNSSSSSTNSSTPKSLSASAAPNNIYAYMPHSTSIIDSIIIFSWNAVGGVKTYHFELVNERGKAIVTQDQPDTNLSLSITSLNLDRENCYYWTVRPKDDDAKASSEQCIYILSNETSAPILDTLAMLQQDNDPTSALGQLMIASFYEDHNIIPRAQQCYLQAIHLAPNVAEYKKSYQDFLKRIGF